MNKLVKIIRYDPHYMGSDEVEDDVWHLDDPASYCSQLLCDGMVYEEGDTDVEYEVKHVKRGGITCELCLLVLKTYKTVKL